MNMIRIMGSRYEVVMTVAKILAVGMGLLNGWLVQHTHSKQGRLRPWYLIFGFCSIIIGALIFQFAGPNDLGEAYWYYFFFLLICYHTVGSSYFFVFKDTIVSLTSRNPSEKMRLTPVCASSKLPRTAYTATLAPSCVAICKRWISLVPPVG